MQRYFINETLSDTTVIYDEQTVHHLLHVLRSKVDDVFIVCDYAKTCYKVKIITINKTCVEVKKIEQLSKKEAKVNVTLAASLIRKERFELMLQKVTELGVNKVIPLTTERSIIKLDDKNEKKKIERWQTITKEACEQSHRDDLVELTPVTDLKNLNFEAYDKVFLAYEAEDETTFKSHLKTLNQDASILMIVGPEGGFSDSEVKMLTKKGAISVTLGSRILRAETASMYALSVISYELETSD